MVLKVTKISGFRQDRQRVDRSDSGNGVKKLVIGIALQNCDRPGLYLIALGDWTSALARTMRNILIASDSAETGRPIDRGAVV
jgi:hypothetical protein